MVMAASARSNPRRKKAEDEGGGWASFAAVITGEGFAVCCGFRPRGPIWVKSDFDGGYAADPSNYLVFGLDILGWRVVFNGGRGRMGKGLKWRGEGFISVGEGGWWGGGLAKGLLDHGEADR
ncbi:hypothetical protein Acr_07g0009700 [Actinidia rufa]|uniref:Uncharacterized protein n=1 Tax=Actinidia rufa TaxID=165716 RepID=A0A7J0EWJ4_9ERIC|nr:hypothetical protein Acr_07g0009700 [Actinidia rufa]